MREHDEYKVIFGRLPHIARNMLLLWGTREFDVYVSNLFIDTRDSKRQGLPAEAASAIFKLYRKHQEEFPETVRPVVDIWGYRPK